MKEFAEATHLLRCCSGRRWRPIQLCVVRSTDAGFVQIALDSEDVGEVWVRGPTVFQSYWRNEKATRDSFVDGWFKTGDLATMNSFGFITIVNRKTDLIISGGENVYSIEVENEYH